MKILLAESLSGFGGYSFKNGGAEIMIPKKIQPYFKNDTFKIKDGNELVSGRIECCNTNEFEVSVIGSVKKRILNKMYVIPINDRLAIELRCRKCGRTIHLFDNRFDGYETLGNYYDDSVSNISVYCKKCNCHSFVIDVQYEYPDMFDLENLDINEKENAFTWIWISIQCSNCGRKYRRFIDYDAT